MSVLKKTKSSFNNSWIFPVDFSDKDTSVENGVSDSSKMADGFPCLTTRFHFSPD